MLEIRSNYSPYRSLSERILSYLSFVLIFTNLSCVGNDKIKTQELLIQEAACVENVVKGDLDRAETRCQLCLEYSSRSEECLNALGMIWYARGVDDKAEIFYRKAIKENNDFAQAWNNMGVLDFNHSQFNKAAFNFERSIEIDPRYLDGRYNLALSYQRLAEIRRASAYENENIRVRRSGKKVSENTVWYNLAENDRQYIEKYYHKAEVEYRKIFELYPTHTNSYLNLASIMTYRAQIEKIEEKRRDWISDAETFYVRCLDLEPENLSCHLNIAHLFLATGRYDESLFHYIQCLAADRENPICGVEIKLAYKGTQLKGEALKKYIQQLAKNPDYALGHYGYCVALFDRGLSDMAEYECQSALKLDSSICLAHYHLFKHFRTVLDSEGALEHARGFLDCAKDAPRFKKEIVEAKETVKSLQAE